MEPKDLLQQVLNARPSTKWEDVIGIEETKKVLLESVVLPIKFPQLFKGSRRSHHAGTLLYGAPGTGKTLLGRALASHIPDAGFLHINASDVISKYLGDSERMIKLLFDKARAEAPCLLVIDDIDLLGTHRYEHEWSKRIATEFLLQMDGLSKEDMGVYVVGTTNVPMNINSSIRRYFSKRVRVPLPDCTARSQMFKHMVGNTNHCLTEDDFRSLGERSDGYTGSDILCAVRDAQMEPIREISKATHFKRVSGPSIKDPSTVVDDLLTPCSAEDPEAIEMELAKIQEDKLLMKKIDMETVTRVLSKTKPTVSKEDLKMIDEFTRDFVQI